MNENDSGRIYHIIRDGMVRMAVRGRELKDTDIVESVDEPDSRAWIEADVHRWLTSHVAVSVYTKDVESEVCKWLDRQAAITKRDTLHDNPTCSGSSTCAASSTCTANRPISESADRETHDTAGIGASKDEIRDFDVWSVAYEIYCAGGYVDNGNEPNPPTDGIRELLDRQAAITDAEWMRKASESRKHIEHETNELQKQVDRLTSERDALAKDLAECMEERDSLEHDLSETEAEFAKEMAETLSLHSKQQAASHQAWVDAADERDYWKQEVQFCMDAAYPPSHAPERPYDPRVMAYPTPDECTTPSTLVSAMIDGLRDDVRDTVMPIVEESAKAKADCERWREACGSMMDAAHEIERIMAEMELK